VRTSAGISRPPDKTLKHSWRTWEARTRRAGGSSAGANAEKVKPPKFDGSTSWAVFHRQFDAAAAHNDWTPREKAAHLQGQAADVLHSVPAGAPYEDIVGALQDRFGDHQLTAAYRSQLKTRVQTGGETLQEFAAAVEQLAHRALVGLPPRPHSDGGRPRFHRWNTGPGSETAPAVGRCLHAERGTKSGREARSGSVANVEDAGSD
jgi:hypothetical protein